MSPDDVILEAVTVSHSGFNVESEKRWYARIGVATPRVIEATAEQPAQLTSGEPDFYGAYGPTADEAITRLCETLARVVGYERAQTGNPRGSFVDPSAKFGRKVA